MKSTILLVATLIMILSVPVQACDYYEDSILQAQQQIKELETEIASINDDKKTCIQEAEERKKEETLDDKAED